MRITCNRRSLILLGLACLPSAAQEPAGVHGTVINSVTREPIRGVQVDFEVAERGSMRELAYGATSTEAGEFSISGMRPGTYWITLKSPGLIMVRGQDKDALPSTTVTLKPGEELTNLRLEMAPYAIISGRATNGEGDPIPARIEAVIATGRTAGGWRDFGYAETDDRGIYQLFLPPGKYTLKAEPLFTPDSDEPEEIRTDGTSEPGYHDIYWENASKKAGSTPVDAAQGRERADVNFNFGHLPLLTINGTVSGIPKGASPVEMKVAPWDDEAGEVYEEDKVAVDAAGKFSITHLDPRRYRLYAGCLSGGQQLRTPLREIELTDSSATVDLQFAQGVELSGKVEVAGGTIAGLTVRLESSSSTRGWGPSQTTLVSADGSFRMIAIQPDRYRVTVLPSAAQQYVTVSVDDQIVKHQTIDLLEGAPGSRVRIMVSRDGGRIAGKAESKGEVLNRGYCIVYLYPDGDYASESLAWQEAGKDGSFDFESLRPGKYRLFAQDFLSSGVVRPRQAAESADLIEVHAGEKVTHNAKAVEDNDVKK